MIIGVSLSPFRKASRKPVGRGFSSTGGHASASSRGRSMVSPKSSSFSMKSFTSFSKDDSVESKDKTDMTFLGRLG